MKLKINDAVKVTRCLHGHGYKIGGSYRISSISGNQIYLKTIDNKGLSCGYVMSDEIEPAYQTRAEKAAWLEANILPAKEAELAALMKEVEDLKAKIVRYQEFSTNEEEVAHLISQIFKTGGDETAIVDVLKKTGILANKEELF